MTSRMASDNSFALAKRERTRDEGGTHGSCPRPLAGEGKPSAPKLNWALRVPLAMLVFLASCTVGPNYVRPTVEVPGAYKENAGWQVAQPQDATLRGNWWEMFNDPQLNAFEEQVDISNQNVALAEAQYRQARALVQQAREDYFQLRTLDTQKQLLDANIVEFQRSLELTNNRYASGVVSRADVLQAQTQLKTTQAQAIDVGVQRAQFEHAIALLIGKPASVVSIPEAPLVMTMVPPPIPVGVPSEVLERRPDIAAAERQVVAANAQIGVALAAYYPTVSLSATGGFESTS